ncbi:hypothetical protein C0991_001438 [Blastosporella zonata]|nr:hypothetical protein C0991_001438 [Blastosporella zonata]
MHYDDRLSNPQLQHLKPDGKPDIVVTSTLADTAPSFFIKLAKDAAEGRKALVENVDLAAQLLTLKTKTQSKEKNTKEKSGNTTADVAPVASMGAIMDQLKVLTEQLAAQGEELKKRHVHRSFDIPYLSYLSPQTTRRLNHRIVLDQAREKLLIKCRLNLSDYVGHPDDLVAMIRQRLSDTKDVDHQGDAKHLSTTEHLNLIFKPSSIRREGNTAAHEADRIDLGAAVLSVELSPSERQKMIDIFKYTYRVAPTL